MSDDGIKLRVLSLGAGVQSTTVALMAARGLITPMPDCAIFADTGAEPAAVYDHLLWLMSDGVLPFPVHMVSAGNLRDRILSAVGKTGSDGQYIAPPFFTANLNGTVGMITRQCTANFKIKPIEKKVRDLLGLEPRQWWPKATCVEMWIGISTDEAGRMKPAHRVTIANRWPLIEQRMSRWDCLRWLDKNGFNKPPKSSCTFCPFRSNESWRNLRDNDPAGWADAVAVDKAVRNGLLRTGYDTRFLYVHRDRVPLESVDLSRGDTVDMFQNECGGNCAT